MAMPDESKRFRRPKLLSKFGAGPVAQPRKYSGEPVRAAHESIRGWSSGIRRV